MTSHQKWLMLFGCFLICFSLGNALRKSVFNWQYGVEYADSSGQVKKHLGWSIFSPDGTGYCDWSLQVLETKDGEFELHYWGVEVPTTTVTGYSTAEDAMRDGERRMSRHLFRRKLWQANNLIRDLVGFEIF